MFRLFRSVSLATAFIFILNFYNAQVILPFVSRGSDNMLLVSFEQSIDYPGDTVGFVPNSIVN
jgi:hypothetical protein